MAVHSKPRMGSASRLALLSLMLLSFFTTTTAAFKEHNNIRDAIAHHKKHVFLPRQDGASSAAAGPTTTPADTQPSTTDPPPPSSTEPPPPPPPSSTTKPADNPPPPPPSSSTTTTDPNAGNQQSSTQQPSSTTQPSATAKPSTTAGAASGTNVAAVAAVTPGTNTNTANTSTRTNLTAPPGGAAKSGTASGTDTADGGDPTDTTTNDASSSGGILANKSAAAGIFTVVGIAAAGLIIGLVAWGYRRHQAARAAREADDDFGFGDDGDMRELNDAGASGGLAASGAAIGGLSRSLTSSTAHRNGGASGPGTSHGHDSDDDFYGAVPRAPMPTLQVVTARDNSFDMVNAPLPSPSFPSAFDPANDNPFKRDSARPGMAGRGAGAAGNAELGGAAATGQEYEQYGNIPASGYSAADYAAYYGQQQQPGGQQWQDGQRAEYSQQAYTGQPYAGTAYGQEQYDHYAQQGQQQQEYARAPYGQNPFDQAEAAAIARSASVSHHSHGHGYSPDNGGGNTDSVYGGQAVTTDSVYYDSAIPLPSATSTNYHSTISHHSPSPPASTRSNSNARSTRSNSTAKGPGRARAASVADSQRTVQKPGLLPTINFDDDEGLRRQHEAEMNTFDDVYPDAEDLETPTTPRTAQTPGSAAVMLAPLRAASPDSFYGSTPRGSMLPSPRG